MSASAKGLCLPTLALELKSSGYTSQGYDQTERAYRIACDDPKEPKALRLELAASEEHPVINPAFVITNWGGAEAALKMNGQTVPRGKDFRFGHRRTPAGKDLIVWLRTQSTEPLEIELTA